MKRTISQQTIALGIVLILMVLCSSPLYAQFGDNLGSHKANKALDMNAKDLTNVALLKYKTLDVGDKATGDIGASSSTVDLYTIFEVPQTTVGQALTLPTPTTPFAGQVAYVKNTGTVPFIMYGAIVAANAIVGLNYNGVAWTVVPTGTSVNTLAIPTTSYANGASISGNTLTLGLADATNPGLVSTAAQTFAGDKTFTGNLSIGSTATPGSTTMSLNTENQYTFQTPTLASQNISGDGGTYNAAIIGKLLVTGTNTGWKLGTLGICEVPSTNSTNITTPLLAGSGGSFSNYSPSGVTIGYGYGSYNRANNNGAGTVTSLYASYNYSTNRSTGTVGIADGTYTKVANTASGTITTATATSAEIVNSGSGPINTAYPVWALLTNSGTGIISNARIVYASAGSNTGTINNLYGVYVGGWANSGTIGASYGLYLDNSIDVGTTKYAIYSGSTSNSYLAGKLGLGITSPSAALHLKAGTSTAGTAPLKLTAGTNLGTTEAGTVEYDGSHLYFTAANAGTRYQLDQQATGAVTAIGGIDTQIKAANGAVVSGNNLVLQTADDTYPGLVSTGTQTIAGAKTFIGNFAQSGTGTFGTGTGAVSINGDATMAATKTLYLAGSTSGNIGLKGNGAVANYTLTLPNGVGASGQVLQATDGAGTLGWTTPATSPITVVNASNLFSTGLTATGNGVTAITNSIFLGEGAGNSATAAGSSIFMGLYAGRQATNANHSMFVGFQAGDQATNAANSIFIGREAGFSDGVNNSGNNSSILIGSYTNTGNYSNSILLGSGSMGIPIANTKANQFMLAPSVTEMRLRGVDYTLPTAQGGVSTVLTNDGSGVLTWTAATGGVSALGTPTGINTKGGSISGSTLTFSLADGTNPGMLSGANWTTFNNKIGAVTATTTAAVSTTTTTATILNTGAYWNANQVNSGSVPTSATYLASNASNQLIAATTPVTTFSGGTTGLTPSSATTGAISLAGTLIVGNGGTGATTLAANGVLIGHGTNAVTAIAPSSTSGYVLTSTGSSSAPTWQAASCWGLIGNTGTTAGTNFIGTTDDIDVVFKRNGITAGFLGSSTYGCTAFGTHSLP